MYEISTLFGRGTGNYSRNALAENLDPKHCQSARSKPLIGSEGNQAGHGYVKPGREDLRPYLALRRKRRIRKGHRRSYRIEKGSLPLIDLRPREVERRANVGHWEDDSLVYTPACPVRLRTTNERVSGVVFIAKTRDRTMREANRVITDEEIRQVEYLLNTRPRKRLGWKTPYQVFYELTGVALQV